MPLYNMFSTRYQHGMDGWKLVQNIVSERQREEGEGGREGEGEGEGGEGGRGREEGREGACYSPSCFRRSSITQ